MNDSQQISHQVEIERIQDPFGPEETPALAEETNLKQIELEEVVELDEASELEEEDWTLRPDPVIPWRWRPYFALGIFFLSLWVIVQLTGDLCYWFERGPIQLGDLSEGCAQEVLRTKLRPNAYAQLKGALIQPSLTTQVRVGFQRRNYAFVLGCNLLLSLPRTRYRAIQKAVTQRTIRPISARGRLMRLTSVASFASIVSFYRRSGVEITRDTWVMIDGEFPGIRIGFLSVLLVFVGLCALSLRLYFVFAREARLAAEQE
ncbi:MAG: hypothetical protein AAGJ35_01535 [Myxococcota bacterium]